MIKQNPKIDEMIQQHPEMVRRSILGLSVREYMKRFKVPANVAVYALGYAREKYDDPDKLERRKRKLAFIIMRREERYPGVYRTLVQGATVQRCVDLFGIEKNVATLAKTQLRELSLLLGMSPAQIVEDLLPSSTEH